MVINGDIYSYGGLPENKNIQRRMGLPENGDYRRTMVFHGAFRGDINLKQNQDETLLIHTCLAAVSEHAALG